MDRIKPLTQADLRGWEQGHRPKLLEPAALTETELAAIVRQVRTGHCLLPRLK